MTPEPLEIVQPIAEDASRIASEPLDADSPEVIDGAATSTGQGRNGWREYFPAATNKTLQKEETEMNTKNENGRLGRSLATTLSTLILSLFLFAASAQANTYVVNTDFDGDDGGCSPNATCSLRDAIASANNHPGSDIINFNILGGGLRQIVLTAPLPAIVGTVTIDGYSQPGSKANTLAQGDNAVVLIQIDGSVVTDEILDVAAPSCIIRGLILVRSQELGILIRSNGNLVTGNFIGTNGKFSGYLPNGTSGILISNVSNNVIGGTSPATRNLISGNTYPVNYGAGIRISGNSAANNTIQGNYIGVDQDVSVGVTGNQNGVILDAGAHGNIVGGTTAGAGNLISGNAHDGIVIVSSASNVIEGNLIGTNANGTAAFHNERGIIIQGGSVANKIGDAVANAGNVISGNNGIGIGLFGSTTMLNEVFSNYIGTKADGVNSLGNGSHGVEIGQGANGNYIGSFAAGATNIIAFNGFSQNSGSGIRLDKDAGTGNSINRNSFYSNSDLGIDLQAATDSGTLVTLNDLNDADSGANSLQNFPVITSAVDSNGTTSITGTLNTVSNEPFRVEIYASPTCNSSGFGEGKVYIGTTTVTTIGNNGTFTFNSVAFNVGQYVTATVTDLGPLNTSEFSQCKQVAAPPTAGSIAFSSAAYSVNEDGLLATITVARTGGNAGAVSVHYQTGGGTGTANTDYSPVSGTINWADGDTASKTFTIPLVDDNLDEPDETVGMTLSNPTGGATLGNQSTATLTIIDNDPPVVVNIADVSHAEGNSGTTDFVFNITLSAVSGKTVSFDYATVAGGTAISGIDYVPVGGTVTVPAGSVSQTVTVFVSGDTTIEPNETFFVQLSNPVNATLGKAKGTGTIVNDDGVAAPIVQFSSATYSVQEALAATIITVTRSGDSSGTTTVDYATADGTATQLGDYELTSGTLTFAPGETSKTFPVLINEDSYLEGTETVSLTLSNVTGGASLGAQSTAVLSISDDSPESATNPNDEAQNFVYQQYHDLLNREPDAGGLAYWTGQLMQCGNNQNCINTKRKDIAAAFYIELEFQETGYFVYRLQKASYGTQPSYLQFMADRSRVDAGNLQPSKQAFAAAWVERAAFKAAYPDAMPADQFVNKLYDTAGLVGYQSERLQAIQDLMTNTKTRAQVLRTVLETPAFKTQEYNPAFVLMQYFGYLRRDADPAGYQFWLNVLNSQLPQDQSGYHAMVCGFVTSAEYQDRFSAIHMHGNNECQ
jgi:CSLREA domain-containing protein